MQSNVTPNITIGSKEMFFWTSLMKTNLSVGTIDNTDPTKFSIDEYH